MKIKRKKVAGFELVTFGRKEAIVISRGERFHFIYWREYTGNHRSAIELKAGRHKYNANWLRMWVHLREIRHFCRQWSLRLTPWPVYWWHYSRDCDLFEVSSAVRHPNGWTAWERIADSYDCAEGPVSWERITRAQYKRLCEDGPITRDIAAEQMNY